MYEASTEINGRCIFPTVLTEHNTSIHIWELYGIMTISLTLMNTQISMVFPSFPGDINEVQVTVIGLQKDTISLFFNEQYKHIGI